MKIPIKNFLKITKKKVVITIIFPIIAILILFSFFVFDEILGLGGNTIVNTVCAFEEYLYNFILLPLNFVDSDFTQPIIFKIAIILIPIWWYFLSCVSIFIKEKRRKR
ncbi:MAG: hypothetical protein J7K54_00780 [Candidatus Aenigmarchaeota archaeon]|nr:hypothetical protein [Candidatus Aenigmarchaeota archaeon]